MRALIENLRGLEWASGDVAVLACQVTNLASLRLRIVARWDLAADERVKMAKSGSTIAIRWDRLVVDVIHCRTSIKHGILKGLSMQSTTYRRGLL